jgi:putative sigma-54 modulation protein
MNIKVITRSCEIKKHEHDYIISKMEHLSRFHINIDHIDVIIKKEGHEYEIELILKALHKDFLIKKKGSTVDEVIDILVDKIGHHMVKHKEKVKDHQNTKINVALNEEFSDIPYTLVYKNIDAFEKMSKQEAAYIVSHNDEKFLVYVDLYTEKLSIAVLKDHVIEIVES